MFEAVRARRPTIAGALCVTVQWEGPTDTHRRLADDEAILDELLHGLPAVGNADLGRLVGVQPARVRGWVCMKRG